MVSRFVDAEPNQDVFILMLHMILFAHYHLGSNQLDTERVLVPELCVVVSRILRKIDVFQVSGDTHEQVPVAFDLNIIAQIYSVLFIGHAAMLGQHCHRENYPD